jgi:hypothetical protein
VKLFWEAVQELSMAQRSLLLRFATGDPASSDLHALKNPRPAASPNP